MAEQNLVLVGRIERAILAIRGLMAPPEPEPKRIGFRVDNP